jgi:hypothetical protein
LSANGPINIGSNTLTLNSGVSGTSSISSNASGTVNYNQSSNGQNVLPGNYGNLTFSNFTKILPNGGTVNIAGTFTTGAAGGHTVTGSTVGFNGASVQTLPAGFTPYNNLTINNASGTNLAGGVTVNGVLTLTNGNINAGANTLTIGSGGSISRTSGHVIGNLQKIFGATGAFIFHVGTANGYSPVDDNVTAGTGQLTVKANQGTAPATPVLDSTRMLQRYWTLSGNGITSNLVFHYIDGPGGDVPATSTESAYSIFRILPGGTALRFAPNGTTLFLDTVANTFSINGLQNYSDWTAGNPQAPTAANVTVRGRVLNASGRGLSGTIVEMVGQNGNTVYAITNPFGYYRFVNIAAGETYIISVRSKSYRFAPRVVNVGDDVTDLDLVPEP